MTEKKRSPWLLSMTACVNINNAIHELTGTRYHSIDQHKKSSGTRKERHRKNITTFLSFLCERNPFVEKHSLRNVATGIIAESSVNAATEHNVGVHIIQAMAGKHVLDYTFNKLNQIITMSSKH